MIVDTKPQAPRSPHWPAVRTEHLRLEPCCAACGGTEHLEVHHVLPFHIYPQRELDQGNLITLCEAPGHNCHYVFGHGLHWHGWNVRVRDDVVVFWQRVTESIRLAKAA